LQGLSHRTGEIQRLKTDSGSHFGDEFYAPRSGSLLSIFKRWFSEFHLGFDQGVIVFAAGIAFYFAIPWEPLWWAALLIVVFFAIIYRFARQVQTFGLIFLLLSSGLARAAWHTRSIATEFLPEQRRVYDISGWIEAEERSGSGIRWRINVHNIDGRRLSVTPKKIRVKVHKPSFTAGDYISLRAFMTAPPGPVVPGGYDPARRAYFSGVGGYGFAVSKAEKYEGQDRTIAESGLRAIAQFRYRLARQVMNKAPPQTAGLQAALLTGIRTHIPDEQVDHLRIAGLAHVLAISGLHMGLLSGGSYFIGALLLAMITPLSRRMDIRKIAALIGACAATAYLVLSGGSVSTQRAYIMAIIVFLAVILDRRAFSIRSVSIAACVTLMFHPESLISAGFQMSFAAAAALVAFYGYWRDRNVFSYPKRWPMKLLRNIFGISVTSFVAGAATGGFAMLHFNRWARFGLIGNVLAMPIFTAIVMPAALGSLILMPFGLENWPLKIMSWGLMQILMVSQWVANLKGAVMHVSSAPMGVLGLYGLGFAGLCLGPKLLRISAIGIITLCLITWRMNPSPDIRISDDGHVAFWAEETRDVLYVGRKNADRYGRGQFTQRAGRPDVILKSYRDTAAFCDVLACRSQIKGYQISIVTVPSEVPEECSVSDIVILTQRFAGPRARRNCRSVLIDTRDLALSGAMDIYLSDSAIHLKSAKTKARRARPWSSGFKPPRSF